MGKKDRPIAPHVRFRCKLIAMTIGGTYMPGVYTRGGDPVLMDDADVTYDKAGSIESVHLPRCHLFWNAPRH